MAVAYGKLLTTFVVVRLRAVTHFNNNNNNNNNNTGMGNGGSATEKSQLFSNRLLKVKFAGQSAFHLSLISIVASCCSS
jgi:hypothetical protein